RAAGGAVDELAQAMLGVGFPIDLGRHPHEAAEALPVRRRLRARHRGAQTGSAPTGGAPASAAPTGGARTGGARTGHGCARRSFLLLIVHARNSSPVSP